MGHFIENHPVFRTPSTSISILYHNTRILIQVCLFQVGSFNYDITKMIFHDEFVAESSALKYEHVFLQLIKPILLILHCPPFRSVLDYWVEINPLSKQDKVSIVLTGEVACNLHI